jgi:hypothetical protein
MKKPLLKFAFTGFLFLYCLSKSFAQSTTKEIEDTFFTIYSKDPGKAVEYAFSTNKYFRNLHDDVAKLSKKLKILIFQCGDYCGYELLTEKTAGQNLKMVTYILRYSREPIRFTFFLYKPNDKWQVNDFAFDEDIDKNLRKNSENL